METDFNEPYFKNFIYRTILPIFQQAWIPQRPFCMQNERVYPLVLDI